MLAKRSRTTASGTKRRKFQRTSQSRSFGIGFRKNTGELKTVDVDQANYVADTTGSVTLLNGVATGTDFTDRIGRKTIMKSLYIQGYVSAIDNTVSNNLSRLIVVYDNQSNGGAPAVLDVLKQATSISQINLNNRDRFKILVNKTFPIAAIDNTATQALAGSPTIHKVKIFKRLKHEVLFNGTGATIASIATGSLYLITIGNTAAGTGGNFNLSTRVRFEDA